MVKTNARDSLAMVEHIRAQERVRLREVLQKARDDLERVAVPGDDFADTIKMIDAALTE